MVVQDGLLPLFVSQRLRGARLVSCIKWECKNFDAHGKYFPNHACLMLMQGNDRAMSH